jgi:YesN/AraC family two-component response regulator
MKSLLDTTPNEYLKQKRLTIAARMLKENNVRVNEICYAVGFKYPSYFTKCFKEVYGLLPADYRKKWSKNT